MRGQIHFLLCWKHVFLLDLEPGPQDASACFSSVFFLPVTPVEAGTPLQTRNSGVPKTPASLAAALGPSSFFFPELSSVWECRSGLPRGFSVQTADYRTLRLTLAGPWLWAETVRLSSSSSALAREAPRLSQIIRFKLSSFSKLDRI